MDTPPPPRNMFYSTSSSNYTSPNSAYTPGMNPFGVVPPTPGDVASPSPLGANSAVSRSHNDRENIPPWGTREETQQQMHRTQAHSSTLEVQNRQLLLERQTAENHRKYGPTTSKQSDDSTDKTRKAHISLAKSFAFKVLLWPIATSQAVYNAREPLHGEGDAAWRLRQMIKNHLPAQYHEILDSPNMLGQFWKQWNAMRNSFKSNLRAHASTLLSEFVDADLITLNDINTITDHSQRKANNNFAEKLLGYNAEPTPGRPQWPLICRLFHKPNSNMFTTDILVKVLVSLLYGPQQLYRDKLQANEGSLINTWGVKKITPQMIATAMIGARWMVSADPDFTPTGKETGLAYHDLYQRYIQLLDGSPDKQDILERFTRAVVHGEGWSRYGTIDPAQANVTTSQLAVDLELEEYYAAARARLNPGPMSNEVETTENILENNPVEHESRSNIILQQTPLDDAIDPSLFGIGSSSTNLTGVGPVDQSTTPAILPSSRGQVASSPLSNDGLIVPGGFTFDDAFMSNNKRRGQKRKAMDSDDDDDDEEAEQTSKAKNNKGKGKATTQILPLRQSTRLRGPSNRG
ncbi:hypothetical protein FRC14_006407 [Serendipita sp. 396]|nr:hypothetical protein FRC14_006407 [Serendipita sp. 396]KAG8778922.1 hypothetical protein FRC15_010484 [Serendipita sp. 397]KAG8819021.1 hypothetical protein FRC19_010188 [Serendipita sp. 401]KAG8848826.1 hypothetical protein FRB91_010471 [Serendipita sp. 411]KAG8865048.1 hypothetical protein FRC20_009938 [Serendipita sp. 405]KAG9051909.1 hypothetical protein FS842_010831 [Serendipita sp. 407]